MPSIEQIANESKALLEDIKSCTCDTKTNTNSIKGDTAIIIGQFNQMDGKVTQLNNSVQAGFTNLAQGLGALIQLQAQNNQLLAGNNQQNETIICWLDKIAHVLCDIKRNTDKEVSLQKDMSTTLTHLDDIFELAHAREAVEVTNRYALEERIAECCPPKEERPKPCFENCIAPRLPDFKPIRTDWKPVQFEKPKEDKRPK